MPRTETCPMCNEGTITVVDCVVCDDTGEITPMFGKVPLDTVPCPRGCSLAHD